MLIILDDALSDARTIAHRILEYENQRSSAAGLPDPHRLPRSWVLLGTDGGERPVGAEPPESTVPSAIVDQSEQPHQDQQRSQRSTASEASEQSHWAGPRTNPYQPKEGAAITNPYSLHDQKKIGNAMATAAHAIRDAARALAEGRGYEPEPPLFELDTCRAKASPETLFIAKPTSPAIQDS